MRDLEAALRSRITAVEPDSPAELIAIVWAPVGLVQEALLDAGITADEDQVLDVQGELAEQVARLRAAATHLVTVAPGAAALASLPAPTHSGTDGLIIDPELAESLMCIPLATEIAQRAPGGRLTVATFPQEQIVVNGLFSRGPEWQIALAYPRRFGIGLIATWLHELGHAVDTIMGTIDKYPKAGKEKFADDLRDLFWIHEPATFADAIPLAAEAMEKRGRVNAQPLPASNRLADTLDWALARAGVTQGRPEMTIAEPRLALAACTTEPRTSR